MASTFRIALAQLNLTVGAISANVQKIIDAACDARDRLHCDLIVFSELTTTGYPPEDLLLRSDFLSAAETGLQTVINEVSGIVCVVGHPWRRDGGLYNGATLLHNGSILARYAKQFLPNYDVFDEKRYFVAGDQPCVVDVNNVSIGVTICEDIWEDGPVEQAVAHGAQIVVNLNASPFHVDKAVEREQEVVSKWARRSAVPIVYVNLVGGQDELVFDGASFVADHNGEIALRCPAFREEIAAIAFTVQESVVVNSVATKPHLPLAQSVYEALVLGVRDYIEKNAFAGAVIGLSGGIDSALTLAIAADAIGAERVEAVMMPSRYSLDMSVEDARQQAEALGVAHHIISIEPMFAAFLEQLQPLFAGLAADTTEENIQARCRGVLLMAISNKKRSMVLTTGNKSEMAVGYATLYGDMAGGYAAIKDVPKTLVYRLARYRNSVSPVIPQRVLQRPPSAELAPDQKDEDSLPPYEVLDPILEAFVEQDRSLEEIVALGFDAETVKQVCKLVRQNEYKRRQAAPGVRISKRAFGRDRRYPLTSGFR